MIIFVVAALTLMTFSLGALFGAWIVESEHKSAAKAVPLMEVVEAAG